MNYFRKYFLLLIVAIFIKPDYSAGQMFNDDVYKFIKTLDLVSNFYVDTVNRKQLVDDAIIEVLKELDPHSIYISKEELQEMNEPLEGSFEGVGLQFNIFNDTILVLSPIIGGPSERVGIRAGDRIIKVDSQIVAGIHIKNKDVLSKLRGKKGTKVMVTIKRPGEKAILDFMITRDKIPIYSIDATYMVNPSTGYIKLSRFAATTMDEYRKSIQKLKAQNTQNLILDLTSNGGGYLNTAVELADEFLDQRKLIVYTQGRQKPREDYTAQRPGNFEQGRVVILIDEGSASASEILSGAIQDWDRGVIIGRRSFGKGLVQRPFDLPDGSMIRLTIARYYTPTGRCIQKPYNKGSDEYNKDLFNRYKHGEFTSIDSIKLPDSLKFQTLINKRMVYGGGGIMPDVFVPLDTSLFSDYYKKLLRKGIINNFIVEYTDKNRAKLSEKYSHDFIKFKANFVADDEFLNALYDFSKKEGVVHLEKESEKDYKLMQTHIKALMARNIWSTSEFFEIYNPIDPIFQKAFEIITSDRYNSIISRKEK